jgi:CubicO group peptidase (beta-lactamase class C family)
MTPPSAPWQQRPYWPTDEWRESRPRDQGMQVTRLQRADRHIREHLPNVYSLLVTRHGYLVFEQYYHGHTAATRFGIQSATKSIISALVGSALQHQSIRDLDQKMLAFFSAYDTTVVDPRKRDITIAHLLTMTAGFAWNDDDAMWFWRGDTNWVQAILERPMRDDPGTTFRYSNGVSHILSAIITQATHMSAGAYAAQQLFAPLGIASATWEADPQGISIGGFGVALSARDMAKFGYLYLNRGWWNGRQIVPAEYVAASTQIHSAGGYPEDGAYGYHWWVTTTGTYHTYLAAGYGGQYIWVIPALDLVAVTTARYDLPPEQTQEHCCLLTDFIVPAVRGA